MKRQLLLLVTIFTALAMPAQTGKKVKTVELNTGYQFHFEKETQDSVRVIFTPSHDSLGIKIYDKNNGETDFLYSQIHHVEFWAAAINPDNTNRNNSDDLERNHEAWRLEFPRLHQGDESFTYEITHYGKDIYGQQAVNFSLEWDGEKQANRWTCYQLYADNLVKKTNRKDNFREDPAITNPQHRTTLGQYKGSGYSRGHLCPSGDRVNTHEQNDQTFFLSNMQAQIQSHNGGVWNTLEGDVRAYASQCDTLYVIKAATIDKQEDVAGRSKSGNLLVPKYFYMALLAYDKAKDEYHALGIWSPHYKASPTAYITIAELEERTGIDFFCNLPDEIEKAVETDRSNANAAYWGVTFYGEGKELPGFNSGEHKNLVNFW
ncbi:MAG: DNA/RNA non-specific endonuclease [Prevotella sp.]|jgi:endonuclease G